MIRGKEKLKLVVEVATLSSYIYRNNGKETEETFRTYIKYIRIPENLNILICTFPTDVNIIQIIF